MVVALLFLVCLSLQLNMDNSNTAFWTYQYARRFIGRNTSDFPDGKFIMNVLYGHTDVPFTIQDLYSKYGRPISSTYTGALIIGNDFKNVGIIVS